MTITEQLETLEQAKVALREGLAAGPNPGPAHIYTYPSGSSNCLANEKWHAAAWPQRVQAVLDAADAQPAGAWAWRKGDDWYITGNYATAWQLADSGQAEVREVLLGAALDVSGQKPMGDPAWPGTTGMLTDEQQVQRAATALQVLAPLGFVDGNEECESPGVVRLYVKNLPGIYRPSFAFNVAGFPSLADALAAVMPKLAEYLREQGREEIRACARKLFGAAPASHQHPRDDE